MTVPSLEFISSICPRLPDGEYVLTAQQQVRLNGDELGWPYADKPDDKWAAAPTTRLQFSVAGPRFDLDPGQIHARFPPPNSSGEYYNVLPHIIFERQTLPWERSIDPTQSLQSSPDAPPPPPWLALLLFDDQDDAGAFTLSTVTLADLLSQYATSATPPGLPEFVQLLPRSASSAPQVGQLKLEVGQAPSDRLSVIDVSKQLLWRMLPSLAEATLMAHVRRGTAANQPDAVADYPVIFCNRLPAPGNGGDTPVGTRSTVHLVSLEGRLPLLDALQAQPTDDTPVRLVSLHHWSFSTIQNSRSFSSWLKGAWCPDSERTDPVDENQPSTCSAGRGHELRALPSQNTDAEAFLAQGYVPLHHQTRQGNHLVSWYRGPLLPGVNRAPALPLPVRSPDQLKRYLSDVGMFEVSYAAAWELGRSLTLRSRKTSLSLWHWKRAQTQQLRQAERTPSHLPYAPAWTPPPDFPPDVSQWFLELQRLEHVPFCYLVPKEEMLPNNSVRFFSVDANWVACLLDGALSVGRTTSRDLARDGALRSASGVPAPTGYTGFLLRSPVVSGWPDLGVEAYSELSAEDIARYTPSVTPLTCVRMQRVGPDTLLCLFDRPIEVVDIHEHAESIHFGVDLADPNDLAGYYKDLRKLDGTLSGNKTRLPFKHAENAKRVLNIAALAAVESATQSAEFAATMIEGVEKVRFVKQIST